MHKNPSSAHRRCRCHYINLTASLMTSSRPDLCELHPKPKKDFKLFASSLSCKVFPLHIAQPTHSIFVAPNVATDLEARASSTSWEPAPSHRVQPRIQTQPPSADIITDQGHHRLGSSLLLYLPVKSLHQRCIIARNLGFQNTLIPIHIYIWE